jgi:hypothetical protein
VRQFDIRNVNRANSFEWSRCNNDAKASFWRNWVCKTYGGTFSQSRMGKTLVWEWKEPPEDELVKWIFTDPEGNEHRVNNFKGFCTEHGLDDARMYNTYTGSRKTHKGWKATRLYGVEGRKNPRDFGRNLPPPARS